MRAFRNHTYIVVGSKRAETSKHRLTVLSYLLTILMIWIIFIFCFTTSAFCADPWSVKIQGDGYKIQSSTATDSDSSVHAAFYRRLLNMIVSRTVVDVCIQLLLYTIHSIYHYLLESIDALSLG